MRFNCVITFRTSRGSETSIWKTKGEGEDHLQFAQDMIQQLKRRQRRPLVIVGVLIQDRDAVNGK